MESLPTWLPHLPSLESLTISYCPLIKSLPDGALPSLLKSLHVKKCDQGFMGRCEEEHSLEWFKIQSRPDAVQPISLFFLMLGFCFPLFYH